MAQLNYRQQLRERLKQAGIDPANLPSLETAVTPTPTLTPTFTPTPTIPLPTAFPQTDIIRQPIQPLFTRQDIPIVGGALAGLVPGLPETIEATQKTTIPQTRLGGAFQALTMGPAIIGTALKNLGLGLTSLVASPLLTGTQLLGGPKQIGPFKSWQEQERELQEAGAGQVVSKLLAPVGEIVGGLALGGRHAVPRLLERLGLRKPVIPTPPPPPPPLPPPHSDPVIEVPPGGFGAHPFVYGEAPQRIPTPSFVSPPEPTFATQLLETVLSGKGKRLVKKQVWEEITKGITPAIPIKAERARPLPPPPAYTKGDILEYPERIIKLQAKIQEKISEPKITKPQVSPPTKYKKGDIEAIRRTLYQPMQESLARMSPAGEKFSNDIQQFRRLEGVYRGMYETAIYAGKQRYKLTPKEQANLFAVREQGAVPLNEKVARANAFLTELYSRWQGDANRRGILLTDDTNLPIGDPATYISIKGNDRFWRDLNNNFLEFAKNMAAHIGTTPEEFKAQWAPLGNRFALDRSEPIAFFERFRQKGLPDIYREKDIFTLLDKYNESAAKRFALTDVFGKNIEKARDYITQLGKETGNRSYVNFASDLLETITSKMPMDWEANAAMGKILSLQAYTKLTPLTSMANVQEGFIGSTGIHGLQYALYGVAKAFTPEGKNWTRSIGATKILGLTSQQKGLLGRTWETVSRFRQTENFNFHVVTNAARLFLKNSAEQLQKNPTNPILRRALEWHGLNPDEIARRGITDLELKTGSFEAGKRILLSRIPEESPTMTKAALGKGIWQFKAYGFKQPRLISSQFKIGKWRGTAGLAMQALLAATLGEINADIWAAIRGEKRPENLVWRLFENYLSTGHLGILYQIGRSATVYGGLARTAVGPAASSWFSAAERTAMPLARGQFERIPEALLRTGLRELVPIGGLLERFVPTRTEREKAERERAKTIY